VSRESSGLSLRVTGYGCRRSWTVLAALTPSGNSPKTMAALPDWKAAIWAMSPKQLMTHFLRHEESTKRICIHQLIYTSHQSVILIIEIEN
jgi:hypothetical protein